jgi:anti-sigma factor RsiW
MVACETLSEKLTGYFDHELDPRVAGEIEAHLRQCVACSARLERDRRLRAAVQRHLPPLQAPERFRDRVRAQVRAEARPPKRGPGLPGWLATAAALVLGVGSGWALRGWQSTQFGTMDFATEIVASHVRSLQGGHLTDVASSEHHTVKPWFAGKLDFSPPVPDFTSQEFPLLGGRLDYLGERQVAALVYGRRQHIINLFVWPGTDAVSPPSGSSRRGFNIVHGTADGMTYWAVSDLNQAELSRFAQLVAADLMPSAGPP